MDDMADETIFYFEKYENRPPPAPVPYSVLREMAWQFLVVVGLVLGARYIVWRWGWSLNFDALWFAVPVALAETFIYIGMVLFAFNCWVVRDVKRNPPPEKNTDCMEEANDHPQRSIIVDVFFVAYDEDPEVVRLGVRDAKKINYPHPIEILIYILDDGNRKDMKKMAEEEGINYIVRNRIYLDKGGKNIGYKAGTLASALIQTYGDFVVICDAETRPFSTILEHTLGYFTDPKVAWVQTPQWFYDIPHGRPLKVVLKAYFWWPGYLFGFILESFFGAIDIGKDPMCNDRTFFNDVIQRRRNQADASLCCGSGSIHRREALIDMALQVLGDDVDEAVEKLAGKADNEFNTKELDRLIRTEISSKLESQPLQYHISEDFMISMIFHANKDKKWKSVYHPRVESKSLSPRDLLTSSIRRFKSAGGMFHLFFNAYGKYKNGLGFRQRLMYESSFWPYFGSLGYLVLFFASVIYLFTGISPIKNFSMEFFIHLIPFLVVVEIAFLFGTWNEPRWKGNALFTSHFPLFLKAAWTLFRDRKKPFRSIIMRHYKEYDPEIRQAFRTTAVEMRDAIRYKISPKARREEHLFRLVKYQTIIVLLSLIGIVFGGVKLFLKHRDDIYGIASGLFNGDFVFAGERLAGIDDLNGYLTAAFLSLVAVSWMSGIVRTAFRKE